MWAAHQENGIKWKAIWFAFQYTLTYPHEHKGRLLSLSLLLPVCVWLCIDPLWDSFTLCHLNIVLLCSIVSRKKLCTAHNKPVNYLLISLPSQFFFFLFGMVTLTLAHARALFMYILLLSLPSPKKGQYHTQRRLMYITATNRTPKCDYNKSISEMESVYRWLSLCRRTKKEWQHEYNDKKKERKENYMEINYRQSDTQLTRHIITHMHAWRATWLTYTHSVKVRVRLGMGKIFRERSVWKTKTVTKLLMYD